MRFFWRIRYLDSRDRQFKDRDLFLDTNSLDSVTAAAVEICNDLSRSFSDRTMLRFRHLFEDANFKEIESRGNEVIHSNMRAFCLSDYFEDENCNELTMKQIAVLLSGSESAMMFPGGTGQHTIDYATSANRSLIHLSSISLSSDQLATLGYFSRDVRELHSSTFFSEGAGILSQTGKSEPELLTTSSDEEIRSFVMIFRRLYMTNERANFVNSADVFCDVNHGHPLANWVSAERQDHVYRLNSIPDLIHFCNQQSITFTNKRLIDVFLYTQYAHQPDERREKQFRDCLSQVENKQAVLSWLFLGVIWECSLHFWNAGKIIAGFYDQYCQYHKINPNCIDSLSVDHPGIGTQEKKLDRQDRLIDEKSWAIANDMWINKGRPDGGPEKYHKEVNAQLIELVKLDFCKD